MPKQWIIVQHYHVNSNEPELPPEVLREFSSYWKAWIYKFFRYHLGAEPDWKFSFSWEIREAKSDISGPDIGKDLEERQDLKRRADRQEAA